MTATDGFGLASSELHVLLIENNRVDALTMRQQLCNGGPPTVAVEHEPRLAAGIERLQTGQFDAVLLDPLIPHGPNALDHAPASKDRCLRTIETVRENCHGTPLIVVTNAALTTVGPEAIQAGAQDYLVKDQLDPDRLLRSIRYSHEHSEHQTVSQHLEYANYQFSLARELQQHLFPRHGPDVPGYEICGHCCPADSTGGDFFDFMPCRKRIDLCIGDAAGHGMAAAMMMTIVRSVLRTLLATRQRLDQIIPLVRQIAGPDFPSTRFVSLLVASLEPSTGVVQIASAGQPALVFGPDGHLKERIDPQYPVIMTDVPIDKASLTKIRLAAGEILLLYTDGVTEASSSLAALYGLHRMEDVISRHHQASAESIVQAMFQDVAQFQEGVDQRDDMTLVVLRRQDE